MFFHLFYLVQHNTSFSILAVLKLADIYLKREWNRKCDWKKLEPLADNEKPNFFFSKARSLKKTFSSFIMKGHWQILSSHQLTVNYATNDLQIQLPFVSSQKMIEVVFYSYINVRYVKKWLKEFEARIDKRIELKDLVKVVWVSNFFRLNFNVINIVHVFFPKH